MGEIKPRAIKTRSIVGGFAKVAREHDMTFYLGETQDGRFALEIFVRNDPDETRPITLLFTRDELESLCTHAMQALATGVR